MYLKNLQLIGFKSFAEKTSLEFLPGVTAIVGPNGCGKSNVADAIRWVLGEQSARALRGGEMADVIFGGTDNRKPLGMAEVSLTIGDIRPEQLRAAGVPIEYNEVTISRRVFRDGHGEYFINKTPVRLKDIQQLFMDTGVGRSSYSLMAQGQIDQILSAHPDDRRMIFEEAAGITKYKSQKKEALRKLEHTEANLLRLADIIREVKRQIGSLQRQAGKARRYRELFEQLKLLETRLARHQYDELIAQLRAHQSDVDAFAAELAECTRQTESAESQLVATRRRLEELEQQTSEVVQRGMDLQAATERHTNRIQFNQERLGELASQRQRAEAEIAAAEEKVVVQQEQLAQLADQLQQAEAALAREQERVTEAERTLREAEARIRTHQEQAEQLKNRTIELESDSAHVRNELSSLDQTQRSAVLRQERLTAEKNSLEEQRAQYAEKVERFREEISRQRAQIEAERSALQSCKRALDQVAADERQVAEDRFAASTEREGIASRLRLLEQLEADPEHVGEVGRLLLENAGQHGLLGSLAGMVRARQDSTAAVESALDRMLQALVVRDPDTARCLAELLRRQQAGRAALLVQNWPHSAGNPGPAPDWSLGWLAEQVECAAEFRPLIERLLGGVLLVDTVETALAHAAEGFDMVTPVGEWIGRRGVVVAGVSVSGPLWRRAQADECRGRFEELTRATETLKQRQEELAECRRRGEQEWEQKTTSLHGLEVSLASKEGELAVIQNESREVQLKLETVSFELNSLASQDGTQAARRQQLLERIEENSRQQRDLREQLSRAEQQVAEAEAERRQLSDQLTEARIALATQHQRRDNLLGQKQPAEARLAELQEGIASRRAEIEAGRQRSAQLEAEIAESVAALERFKVESEEVQRILAQRAERRQEINARISEQEERIRILHRQMSETQQRKNGIEIKLSELRMTINHLKERIQQKYQTNLEDIRGEGFVITIADSGRPEIHEVSAAEAQQAGVNVTNWEEVQQQVVELQSRLDAMGPVNLGAVEEFEELEQRHKFLCDQQEDLVRAKEQLLEVIARINTTTKQMFTETFEKIRANFQEMFSELFGGGKANLLLVDEGDVLESGIEIVARPPGKQLQSISLLSGGERTMTAVALLFAIYMVKPSPFCVLDELDAPLDESNINRFIKILQRFLQQSQFIIITHNKRTIAMSDALYGVTMEEQGVSKIVSVKFRKHGELVPADNEPPGRTLAGESPIAHESPDAVSTDEHLPPTRVAEPPSPEEMERWRKAQATWTPQAGAAPAATSPESEVAHPSSEPISDADASAPAGPATQP